MEQLATLNFWSLTSPPQVSSCGLMAAAIFLLSATVRFSAELSAALPQVPVPWLRTVAPLAFLTVYMVAFGVGAGTIPYILLGELVPTKVREARLRHFNVDHYAG